MANGEDREAGALNPNSLLNMAKRMAAERNIPVEEAARIIQQYHKGGGEKGRFTGGLVEGFGKGNVQNIKDRKTQGRRGGSRGGKVGGGGTAFADLEAHNIGKKYGLPVGEGTSIYNNYSGQLLANELIGFNQKVRNAQLNALGLGTGSRAGTRVEDRSGPGGRTTSILGGNRFGGTKNIARNRYQENIEADKRRRLREEDLEKERGLAGVREEELRNRLKLVTGLFGRGGNTGRDTTRSEQLVTIAGRPETRTTTSTTDRDRTMDILNAIMRGI